jgi:hypothetical protein
LVPLGFVVALLCLLAKRETPKTQVINTGYIRGA